VFPETPAAAAALSVATRYYSPALLNHCIRCYLWGATYSAAHGIAFDDELYYVAALLHDMGLRRGGRLAGGAGRQGFGDHRAAHAR
jgi:hypothetical protein